MKQKQLKPRKKCIEMENKNELCQLFTLTLKKQHKHSVRAASLTPTCGRQERALGFGFTHRHAHSWCPTPNERMTSRCGQSGLTCSSFPRKADYI